MTNRPGRHRGFTLIEVLAALAIAATGLLAVAKTINNSVDIADATATRMVATWVASNHMAELRLSDGWPAVGDTNFSVEMGGREWTIRRNIESTPDEDVYKVVIDVFAADDTHRAMARVDGYLARLEKPVPIADPNET